MNAALGILLAIAVLSLGPPTWAVIRDMRTHWRRLDEIEDWGRDVRW